MKKEEAEKAERIMIITWCRRRRGPGGRGRGNKKGRGRSDCRP